MTIVPPFFKLSYGMMMQAARKLFVCWKCGKQLEIDEEITSNFSSNPHYYCKKCTGKLGPEFRRLRRSRAERKKAKLAMKGQAIMTVPKIKNQELRKGDFLVSGKVFRKLKPDKASVMLQKRYLAIAIEDSPRGRTKVQVRIK